MSTSYVADSLKLSGTIAFALDTTGVNTITVPTILKTGGGTGSLTGSGSTGSGIVITGGELVIRTDAANDILNIGVAGANGATTFIISGTGGLTKTGAGTLLLNNTNTTSDQNTFTGTVTINEGSIQTYRIQNFGNSANSVVLNGGTWENVSNSNLAYARNIIVGVGGGTLANTATSTGNTATYTDSTRTVTLNGPLISRTVNSANTIAGTITGTGSFTVNSTGSIATTLSGSNNFTGDTRVQAGVLTLNNTNALAGSTLDLATVDTGTVNYFAGTNNIGGLKGTRNIALATLLSIGANNQSTTYGGVKSLAGGLTKVGTGTLTLTGQNNYTGITTVSTGTLALGNNALSTASAVNLSGGTLAVTNGTTNGDNGTGGTLSLGAGTSTINFGSAGTSTVLSFGNSAAATWTGNLIITGYTGPGQGNSSSTTQLFVGGSPGNGLTGTQLGQIFFSGYSLGGAAQQLSSGEVVPQGVVPEPGTILGIAAIGLGIGNWIRRRRAKG